MTRTTHAPTRLPARTPAIVAAALLATAASAQAAESCRVRSGDVPTPVVELYTSEGCSSCPPADKWLSTLKSDPRAVALAFHVDYWDRLGWKDRFASAAWTERQASQQRVNGARFSYTPQVVVNGRDQPDWPRLRSPLPAAGGAATVDIALEQVASKVNATVTPDARAPKRLAAYWAVTEQSYVTSVRSGENGGATLHHDFVVRDFKPVAAWSTGDAPKRLEFDLPGAGDPAHPRLVNLVVVDADSGRPVQAAKLGC